MELFTIFLLWLAITIIDNLAKRKKRRLPPQNQSPDFDIPTLGNDPNLPGEEIPIFIENPRPAEVQPMKPKQPKKIPAQVREVEETNEFNLNLTPSKIMNSFIITELLDKPKALRHRR